MKSLDNKLRMTKEEAQTLIATLEWGLSVYEDKEPDEDGQGGEIIFVFNDKGELSKPDSDHKAKVLQGIIERIEVVEKPEKFPACGKCKHTDADGQEIDINIMGAKVSPHEFVETEVIPNVNLQILKCKNCGMESYGWTRAEE